DTLVHFFSDRPLSLQPILQSGIKRVVVAGPGANCFRQGRSMVPFAGFDGEIYDTPALAVRSVAEHAFCLLLMLAKNIRPTLRDMEKGAWPRAMNQGLAGQTIGVIGFGAVAQTFASLCASFGMQVLVAARDTRRPDVIAQGYQFVSLPELLGKADFISLHKRLTADTQNMLSESLLALMKPQAQIINTSRAELIDTQALLRMLDKNRLAGAALDVFEQEPLPANSRLRSHPAIIATPHNAWLTATTITRMIAGAVAAAAGNVEQVRRVH